MFTIQHSTQEVSFNPYCTDATQAFHGCDMDAPALLPTGSVRVAVRQTRYTSGMPVLTYSETPSYMIGRK
jgi:hypothetical protein